MRVRLEQSAVGANNRAIHIMGTPSCCIPLGLIYLMGVVSIDSLEVLCKGCRVMYISWLLETPAMSLTIQSHYKWLSSAEEMVSLVPVNWGLRCDQGMGHREG